MTKPNDDAGLSQDWIFETLKREIPALTPEKLGHSFSDLGIDSFDLVSIRSAIESARRSQIPDAEWMNVSTPTDIMKLFAPASVSAEPEAKILLKRKISIGMPQMAISGLSESWLFKEVGDAHWQMITDGIGMPSSQLVDGNGDRLYATFTRIKMESTVSLKGIRENETFEMEGAISRYGAGIFVSSVNCNIGRNQIRFRIVSSFSKRGVANSNQNLIKGQPTIPDNSPISVLAEKPVLVEEYRMKRSEEYPVPLFECDYKINPYHDINGVGLLYFAAYPSISDTCELNYIGKGNGWALTSSTVARDVYYFANSEVDATLLYKVLRVRDLGNEIEIDSLIARKEGGLPMAYLSTRKVKNV